MARLVEASYIVERDCRLLCADGRENVRSGGLVRTATAILTKAEEDQELVDTVCFAVKSRRRRDCSTLLVV